MSLIYTQFIEDNEDLIPEIEFIFNDFSVLKTFFKLEIIFYIRNDDPITIRINSFLHPPKFVIAETLSKLEFARKFHSLNDNDIAGILVNLYI